MYETKTYVGHPAWKRWCPLHSFFAEYLWLVIPPRLLVGACYPHNMQFMLYSWNWSPTLKLYSCVAILCPHRMQVWSKDTSWLRALNSKLFKFPTHLFGFFFIVIFTSVNVFDEISFPTTPTTFEVQQITSIWQASPFIYDQIASKKCFS